MTHILRERFDRQEGPHAARLFSQPQRIAAAPPPAPRLAYLIGVDEGARFHLLVKAELIFEISIELMSPDEEQQTSEQRPHAPS